MSRHAHGVERMVQQVSDQQDKMYIIDIRDTVC